MVAIGLIVGACLCLMSKLGRLPVEAIAIDSIPVERVVERGAFRAVNEFMAFEAAWAAGVKLLLGNRRSIKYPTN